MINNRWAILGACVVGGSVMNPGVALADVVLKVDTVAGLFSPVAPIDASVDVFFGVTGSPPPPLAGYDLVVNLAPSGGGLAFTGADNPDAGGAHPPIFPNGPIDFSTPGDRDHRLLLSQAVPAGSEPAMTDGAGLVRVQFQISPGTLGIFDVTIDSSATLLLDNQQPDGGEIAFTDMPGQIIAAPPGDANIDGQVDVADLGILGANFGLSGRTWLQADFNLDGLTDVADLGILAANFDSSQNLTFAEALEAAGLSSIVTPEPTAMAMLVVAMPVMLRRRR